MINVAMIYFDLVLRRLNFFAKNQSNIFWKTINNNEQRVVILRDR